MWRSSVGRSLGIMSTTGDVTAPSEPVQVATELDDLSTRRRRISSASTSSFDDLDPTENSPSKDKEIKPEFKVKVEDHTDVKFHEPAVINTEDIDDNKGKPPPPTKSVVLTYKTHAFDDPTFYSQSSLPSATSSSAVKPRAHATASLKASRTTSVNMAAGQDRDPDNVNEIVKINFEEVFAEPEGTYSFGTIWGASYRIFNDSKLWCYRFLAAACAFPCALCWGIHFACLSFCQIWYCQPAMRSFKVQLRPFARIYGMCVKSFVEPCCGACGHILGSIRVHVTNE